MSAKPICRTRLSLVRLYTERVPNSTGSGLLPKRRHTQQLTKTLRHVQYLSNTAHRFGQNTSPPQQSIAGYAPKDVQQRRAELDLSNIEQYPRITESSLPNQTLHGFMDRYKNLEIGAVEERDGQIIVSGRIVSVRKSGGKLAFVDIVEEPAHQKLQILLNLGHMEPVDKKAFSDHVRLIRRGDIISARGFPCRSSSGELSLRALELTKILSPCLHTIPLTVTQSDQASDSDLLDRSVEMLADPSIIQTLVTRSKIISAMRHFLEERYFCEVHTPILSAAAGGATARPFDIATSEFLDKKLSLRIAPELWLKKLVVGGMRRVFEIGPSFRNEGVDKTHNPEFTTCEFYAAYHSISQLQRTTEDLLRTISKTIYHDDLSRSQLSLEGNSLGQFAEIDFIPAINSYISTPLPSLTSPQARSQILDIFASHSIPLPDVPTLPKLLDKLCSHFLEPSCISPTWIVNTPECLSPLAKSFTHPTAPNNQLVAARAELFIHQKEIVNCYEEENSPYEQRRKFVDQQKHARLSPDTSVENTTKAFRLEDHEAMKVDEDYLRALEWGLPPTGGWGCGIDRLTMLFTGKERIGDVLTFGNLKAVTRGAHRASKNK